MPLRSKRRSSSPTAKKPNSIETAANAPNQNTGSSPPTDGRPISRRKCASFSRSNASLAVPMKNAIPSSISSTGCPRTKRPPSRAVVPSSLKAPLRSSRGRRRKPVSDIRKIEPTAQTIETRPPAMTAH